MLKRMDQLMEMVSGATKDEKRQSLAKMCRLSMEKLRGELPEGVVQQLSARSNHSDASGSETWEPAGCPKDLWPISLLFRGHI